MGINVEIGATRALYNEVKNKAENAEAMLMKLED